MSLYREAGRRRVWPAVAAAVLVLAVFLAGFALGRAGADASLADALEQPRERTAEVLAALELLTIEYPQGAEAASEYEGADANVERMQDAFADARDDLALLDPEATDEASTRLGEVAELVENRMPPAELERAVERAEKAVRALPAAG